MTVETLLGPVLGPAVPRDGPVVKVVLAELVSAFRRSFWSFSRRSTSRFWISASLL